MGALVAYRRDGLDDEAIAVARAAFETTADASTYAELRDAAAGTPRLGSAACQCASPPAWRR